jgi:hypothetical protein
MATSKARFLVSRTRETIGPGEEEGSEGYVFQDHPMSLEEAIAELETCAMLSSHPIRSASDLSGREWASSAPEEDYRTGAESSESVFLRSITGKPLEPHTLFRVLRLADLVS